MSQFLKEIEENYDVKEPKINGKQAWPILRVPFAMAHIRNLTGNQTTKSGYKRKFTNLASGLYGYWNWFGNYEYLFFTSSRKSSFKKIDNRLFDRFTDPIIERLGRDDVLKIESPAPNHFPHSEISAKHVVSVNFLNTIAEVRGIVGGSEIKIENEAVIKKISSDHGIAINYRNILERFEKRYQMYVFLLGRYHPRAVFLVSYYDEISRVKAAKDLGIPVIEIQHGSIGTGHEAYNVFTDLDRSYFPDYMLVFGEKDKELFSNNLFIDSEKVYPVGSFYIDYVKKKIASEESITKKLEEYSVRVAITLQSTVEDPLIEFVNKCAEADPKIVYILIPRHPTTRDYELLKKPENVVMFEDNEFYELMNYVDIHATVYSGCAIEAPSFGAPNILININGLSRMYLSSLLDSATTSYVETPAEFLEAVKRVKALNKTDIIKANEPLIKPDYERNIEAFLERFLKSH